MKVGTRVMVLPEYEPGYVVEAATGRPGVLTAIGLPE